MTLQTDPNIEESSATLEELEERLRRLVDSYPAAIPIVAQILDHLTTMAPGHLEADTVMVYYRFCRDSPEMAILLAALCHVEQDHAKE